MKRKFLWSNMCRRLTMCVYVFQCWPFSLHSFRIDLKGNGFEIIIPNKIYFLNLSANFDKKYSGVKNQE